MEKQPILSIIVVGYKMPRQLENTLYSLSNEFQLNVHRDDYEVIVVENESQEVLDPLFTETLSGQYRYFLRSEASQSPVAAVNFGFSKSRGEFSCLIIDGARMLTPRTLEFALMAYRMNPQSVVMVPGYHLGDQEQHLHDEAYSFERDESMLESIDWKNNGYKLFAISTFSNGNRRGFLQPMMECSCVFSSLAKFEEIGYADERFTLAGGGAINLHIYRKLGMLENSTLVVLAGEGSFHQFHGGVTTSNDTEREKTMAAYTSQLNELWPGGFQALRRDPILLGAISKWATPHLSESSRFASVRFDRLEEQGKPKWPDDNSGL